VCCFGFDVAVTYCQLAPWSGENWTSTKRTSPFTCFFQAILSRFPALAFFFLGARSVSFGGGVPDRGALMVTGTQPWSLLVSESGRRRAVLMNTHRS
jgi:anti-sigma factor RsiW